MATTPLHLRLAGLAGIALLAIALFGLGGALGFLGQPFPGFLVLENGVVASAGVPGWPATEAGEIFQHEVVALEGQPIADARDLLERVAGHPVGTPLRYRFRKGTEAFDLAIETRRFELRDFGLLFGTYLVNGLILGSCGILVLLRGRPGSGARATVPFLLVGAAWGLTALDLYGPSALFRLHAAFESFLFAASLHMALGFPRPGRGIRPEILVATYLVAGALAVAYQIALPHPDAYVQLHLAATSAAGAALLALLGIQGTRYVLEHRSGVRREMRGLGLGALLAVVPIIALMIAESFTGGKAAQNAVGLTAFLFALAVSHAALRARAHESV